MKKHSIRDVAELAGVSTATVSHVLNGTRQVTNETRDKVLAAINVLQYTPNIAARGFRTGHSKTIAFIVPDIRNLFFSGLIEAIESSLSEAGYHLVVANTKENPSREIELYKYFTSGVVDGIIAASTLASGDELLPILPPSFPVVLVDRRPSNSLWDTITISSDRAIADGVSYLAAKGHQKIGFIYALPHLSTTMERLSAFKNALVKNNIDVNEDYILCSGIPSADAAANAERLLKAGCTAIVVCNGIMTFEVQQYLWEHNYSLGDKIDVIGFKDEYYLAAGSHYISQPVEELGALAVSQILTRINSDNIAIRDIALNSVFITG